MSVTKINSSNKEIYRWSNDLIVYRDGIKHQGIFKACDVQFVDDFDEYISVACKPSLLAGTTLIYFKNGGKYSWGNCIRDYYAFVYRNMIHECYRNNRGVYVYVYGDQRPNKWNHAVNSYDATDIVHEIYGNDTKNNIIEWPTRVYNVDWPCNIMMIRSRNRLNDIQVVCSG